MITGFIVFLFTVLFFIFLGFYKKNMIVKMFSLQASTPASELQLQLEKTADSVIRRLETHISHLELLLDEADAKIAALDTKLQMIEDLPPAGPQAQPQPSTPERSPAAGIVDFRLPPELPVPEAPEAPEAPRPLPLSAAMPLLQEVTQPKDNKDGLTGNKRRLITSMAAQGYSVTEIAKATGMGKGEIMLFLQLNRK